MGFNSRAAYGRHQSIGASIRGFTGGQPAGRRPGRGLGPLARSVSVIPRRFSTISSHPGVAGTAFRRAQRMSRVRVPGGAPGASGPVVVARRHQLRIAAVGDAIDAPADDRNRSWFHALNPTDRSSLAAFYPCRFELLAATTQGIVLATQMGYPSDLIEAAPARRERNIVGLSRYPR